MTNDDSIKSFQGQIYESYNDFDSARHYYQKAQDIASIVKMQIAGGNLDQAEALCNQSGDTVGCYCLARHYEEAGDNSRAIELYKKGKHYSHTIRLAIENGEEDMVYSTALQAPKYV